MKHKKAIALLYKYLYQKPTLEQKATIDKWYESIEEKNAFNSNELLQIKESLCERTWEAINTPVLTIPFYKKQFFKIAAAAVFILGLIGGYFMFFTKIQNQNLAYTHKNKQLKNDIAAPIANKAVLTLADGTIIPLDSIGKINLVQQGNSTVKKLADGTISYTEKGKITDIIEYNTISVPRGSKPVQLKLADGTEVWLNVASSITYPATFTGKERQVKITGEAYFEVAHNVSMPFKVINNGTEIKVLGTHFNVKAYADEPAIKVTLLEGAVKINKINVGELTIKPGQQGLITNTSIKLNEVVDIEEVMAWKNGWFVFNSMQVSDIMKTLDKWYDLEVVYEGEINQKHFSGIVSRSNNLSEILKIMEPAGIKFKIDGNKIVIH